MSNTHTESTTATALLQQMLAEFGRDGHGHEFEDGEHPLIDEVRAFLTGTPYAVRTKQARAWRIYIAGPMTGLPDLNVHAFNAAADALRTQGWHVENPADHGVIEGAQWEDYLAYDITRLVTCGAIYLLPGWEKSKGATLEAHIAKTLGLQVLLAPGAEDVQPLQKTVPQKFTGDSEMRRAFEIEYGQNWTDPDWRRETGIWAAAWHKATAAVQQGVQDAEPAAWVATFKPEGLLALHSVVGANLEELKQSVPGNSVFRPLYTHPATQTAAQQPVEVTDDMALAFHQALTDGALGADELEDIKTGLRAALANVYATTQGLEQAVQKVVKEWQRQKNLFPQLHKDGWMDLALSELAAQAKEHTA